MLTRFPSLPGQFWLLTIAFAAGFVLFPAASQAEGSRSLYPTGYTGSRANLDIEPGNKYVGKVNRRTFLYVYAQAGESILLGSSNRNNGGDIRVYNPQNFGTPGDETIPSTADFTCSSAGAGRGYIDSRARELAGPLPASATALIAGDNRFLPCVYTAPTTGIYGVEFTGATSGGENLTGSIAAVVSSTISVAAWDVTVRADANSTTDLNGRLFTYAWVGYTGGNNRPVYSTHYYVTADGYRYSQDLRGLDPNGYALYANSLGFLDNGQPLFKDIRGQGTGNDAALVRTNLPVGVTTQSPQYPIFFSDVAPSSSNNIEVERVLTALTIPLIPPAPTITNISFKGPPGTSTTTTGVGGEFTFSSTNTITYEIVISRDGSNYDPANPLNAVLTGSAGTGTHKIQWNGKDNSGNNFPPNATYPFRIIGHNGDIHFPLVDAENNPNGGPTITRLNGTGVGTATARTVYYDDRGYRTRSGQLVGNLNGTLCPNPTPAGPTTQVSLLGVDSSTAYRNWTSGGNSNSDCAASAGWGDAKALDLWTYFSTDPQSGSLTITPTPVDVATSISAPSIATPGSTVQGVVSFGNNGTNAANGVGYIVEVDGGCSPALTFGNLQGATVASCTVVSGKGQYVFNGWPTTLNSGQAFSNVTFSYTAPAIGPVVVTSKITTTDNDVYTPNNIATVSTGVGQVDVLTTVSVPTTVAVGGTVSGTFSFSNNSAVSAAGVTYTATVDSGTCPPSFQFNSLPLNVTATCANGTISFTGLPDTLVAGRTFDFGFSYTMPASGPIPVNTTIATTSTDANLANNTASGSTAAKTRTVVVAKALSPTTDPGRFNLQVNNITGKTDAGHGDSSTAVTVNVGNSISVAELAGTNTVLSHYTTTLGCPGATVVPGANNQSGSFTMPDADVTCTFTNTRKPQSDLEIKKTVSNATPYVGDTITFTVTATNKGSDTATNVIVSDSLPTGLSLVGTASASQGSYNPTTGEWSIGTLTLNQSVTLTMQAKVLASGSITNTAAVTTNGGPNDPNSANNTVTATINAGPTTDIQVNKTVDNPTPNVGANVTYTVTVKNAGPSNATGLQVTDTLPAGLTLVSATPSVGTYSASVWNIGALLNDATATLKIVATVNVPGSITNTATKTAGNEYDPNRTNDTAGATINGQQADIQVFKTVSNANPAVNTQVTFTITATNLGPSAATGVVVKDALPAGFTLGTATPSVGSYTAATGLWTVGNLAASGTGATATLALVVTVTQAGSLTNTATKTVSDQTDPNSGNNASTVALNGIQIIAQNDTGGMVGGASGGQAYTNVLNNNGNGTDTLNGVPVTLSTVNLTQSSTTHPGVTLDPITGAINVASGTPAGTYSVVYQICDRLNPGICATATATATVTAATIVASNNTGAPVLSVTGGTVVPNVLANDTLNGATPTAGPGGTVVLSPVGTLPTGISLDTTTGAVTVAPGTYPGSYNFQYKVCEALNPTNCANANVTVPVGPQAVNDSNNTAMNTPVTGSVATNDRYQVGSNFSLTGTPAANGTVVLNSDGTYTYTPKPNFVGTDSFTYQVCAPTPNQSVCSTATMTITVVGTGNLVLQPDTAATSANTPVTTSVLSNDSTTGAPINPASLTVPTAGAGAPTNGTVTCTAGSCTYTPNAGFSGTDTYTYQVCDTRNPTPVCATQAVTVTVGPQATNDTTSTTMNTLVNSSVAGNDRYATGSTFTATNTPSHGAVSLNPDGSYSYTPSPNFVGTDSFTYQVCAPSPNQALCSTGTVTVTINPTGSITLNPDTAVALANTPVQTNVLANDSSTGAPLDPASLTVVGTPSSGTVVCANTGICTYTPNPGFSGTDTYSYRVCDTRTPTPVCATQTVTVTVGPQAANDTTSTTMNTPVTGNVAGNDRYTTGSTFTATSTPAHGTVTVNPNGTFTYTPAPNYSGTDSFTYQVCAPTPNQAQCSTATVNVTINPAGGLALNPDTVVTLENTPVQTNVLANDSSTGAPLDPASLTVVGTPSSGTVVCANTGICTYTPNPGFSGTDTYSYRVCDTRTPTPVCATQTVTVVIRPQATDDTPNTRVNTVINGNVATNDRYPSSSIFTATSTPAHGTVTMNPDGTYTYTPNPNFVGTDSFTYQVCVPVLNQAPYTDTSASNAKVTDRSTYKAYAPASNSSLCSMATVTIRIDGGPMAQSDLSIHKSSSPDPYIPGQELMYTVVVSNAGPSDVVGAKVTDTLPAAFADFSWSCLASDGNRCTVSGRGNLNDTVDVRAHGTLTYTFKGTVPSNTTGSQRNTATVTPPAGITDPSTLNNTVINDNPSASKVDLSAIKYSKPAPYIPGQTLTYTILIRNAGPSDAVNALVSDPLPTTLAKAGFTWTCQASPGSQCMATGSGNINDSVTVLAGGLLTYTVSGIVPIDTRGIQTNTVSVSAPAGVNDGSSKNNVASSATDSTDPTDIPTLSQWAVFLLLVSLLLLAGQAMAWRGLKGKGRL